MQELSAVRKNSNNLLAHRSSAIEMPLRQYFLFAGGALLSLLLAANAVFTPPASNKNGIVEPQLPQIRIHSEHKGPEAIVIDTSLPSRVQEVVEQLDATSSSRSGASPDASLLPNPALAPRSTMPTETSEKTFGTQTASTTSSASARWDRRASRELELH
jgi:hypothetical protein